MRPIKFCPYCGSDDIRYHDQDVPYYAFCRECGKWVSGAEDFTLEEIRFITSRFKMIRNSKVTP